MRDITCFSANTVANFDNNYENMLQFNDLVMNAARHEYGKYTKDEVDTIIRNQFNKIIGIDFKNATPMKRRQAWRDHGKEIYTLIEDVILDRMVSGWNSGNARFMEFVQEINIADGDENSFYVNDPSLLQVSVWAGEHHDVVRQKVLPGKSFSIETSNYVIKVYADYELFQMGKVDFAGMVDLMYRSIEQYRYSALYTAFMSMDTFLPADMKTETPITAETRDTIIEQIEAVRAATGKDVILVGTRIALQKLQNTVGYQMWSGEMKQERHEKGILGMWEGYDCLALERVNKVGTRDSIFTEEDNKKIFILPVDSEFKPIVRVNEGDVEYFERGFAGDMQDRTVEASIWYKEGIGVIINQLFGEIVEE